MNGRGIDSLRDGCFDVLIVGAGINGAVSAAALAAHGVRVALIDRGDFAGATSQESSNLAWGGIKYLENHEFALVRELCRSRNTLLASYPSRVREIRFLASVAPGFRHHPRLLWLGAWLYWLMGSARTRAPRWLSPAQVAAEEPVVDARRLAGAIEYSDAYLRDNDARFVFDFVRSALDSGATAVNYVDCLGAERRDGHWHARLHDRESGAQFGLRARVLINAGGGHADALNAALGQRTRHRHVFSKGIHLIVERLTPDRRVLAFFADDGRLFFVIPMGPRTCLGTTDTRVSEPHAEVSDADRAFVLDNINARLRLAAPLTRADIIAERCGVRPLVVRDGADASADFLQMSRRHVVEADVRRAQLTIFGGKLTDCLNVGAEVCALAGRLGLALREPATPWYGEPGEAARLAFMARAGRIGLTARDVGEVAGESAATRLWRRYGVRAQTVLEHIEADPRGAEPLIEGSALLRAEVPVLADSEMIVRLEDFLRRRSMLALTVRHGVLRSAPGLREACDILFGAEAARRHAEYFQTDRRGTGP